MYSSLSDSIFWYWNAITRLCRIRRVTNLVLLSPQVNQFFNPDEFERFAGDDLADAFDRMDFRQDGSFFNFGPGITFLLST
jgi:hypothetical protein